MQKRHYTDINRYEQSSLKGEKKKSSEMQCFHNTTRSRLNSWRRDSMRWTILAQNSEQTPSCAQGIHPRRSLIQSRLRVRVQQPLCPPERLAIPVTGGCALSPRIIPHLTQQATIRWRIRPCFCSPLGRSLLQLRVFFFGVLVFVLQGCSKFSFFKLSILNAIVYSRI